MVREIPLTQGKVALVDDEDYERVMQFKWCAVRARNTFYAARGRSPMTWMHRFIAGASEVTLVDHRDRNGLNNTRGNLREATRSQNSINRRIHSNNTSGCPGVSYNKRFGKWQCRIRRENKTISLGVFTNVEDAIRARKQAEVEMFGEFRPIDA